MEQDLQSAAPARRARLYSFIFLVLVVVSVGWLHLAPLVLTALFSYLILNKLWLFKRRGKLLSVLIFLALLAGITYGTFVFFNVAKHAFPAIANKAIPSLIELARRYQVELPFTDYDSLRESALDFVASQSNHVASYAKFAQGASMQLLFLVAGCVVAISFFLNPHFSVARGGPPAQPTLYSEWGSEFAQRFRSFYRSFATVIGAQIVISAINTLFTSIFVFAADLPHALLVVVVTFACGLLPVIGNLISNTIIVGIGLTVSPKMALVALVFLVVIHKLEYFLNSRIIGQRIRNPLWLTLLGLIVGERLMGIPGIILAPVILDYIRVEASKIPGLLKPSPPPEGEDL